MCEADMPCRRLMPACLSDVAVLPQLQASLHASSNMGGPDAPEATATSEDERGQTQSISGRLNTRMSNQCAIQLPEVPSRCTDVSSCVACTMLTCTALTWSSGVPLNQAGVLLSQAVMN